ncbi:TRAP transporter substrate-binding protein [Sphaerotilus sp.]|uniref:TRAP transporter substrate-binding protein n=1 Tax=Sphaerotilus sp. TaxID=2093942 RepID=UPI0034E2EBD6
MPLPLNRLAGLLVAAALSLSASHASAQTVTLKFSHFLPSTGNFQRHIAEPWCAAIAKDSGGRLACQIFPSLQLGGTPAQLPDQVKNGVADIVWTSPSFATGRFPRTEALELPFSLPPGGLSGSRAMWEYYQKHAQDDYKDFKVLAVFSASNVVISTASKPVLTADGFKGLKLRSPSRFAALLIGALGGTPVNLPVAAITEAISKGVIDGAMAPWEILPTTKIDEVTKYHMEGLSNQPGFTQTPMAILMNKAKYDGLPADLKAVIDKHSGAALSDLAGRVWDQGNDEARQKMTAQGNKVLVIKPQDYAVMKAAGATVEADWIKQADAKGLDGKKLAAEVHAIGAKYLTK